LSGTETYVSTDVETDGPIPGPYSMLSFASAAYLADKTLLGTFSANLETLPGASADPRALEWWKDRSAAYEAARRDAQKPEVAMMEYVEWLKSLPGRPVFVGYPGAFDFMFVYWYLMRFAGESPFGYSGIDIKTYAMAVLKKPYRATVKAAMPVGWFDGLPHTHRALDDALEQGALFCNMLAAHGAGCLREVE
jgi:hypothetical protein